MKVKDLIKELKRYDKNIPVEILVQRYNMSQEETVDETIESINNIIYTHDLSDDKDDSLRLRIVLYEE